MSARERLTEALRNPGLVGCSKEEAAELIDAVLQEHTAEVFAPIWEMAVDYMRNNPSLLRPPDEPTA